MINVRLKIGEGDIKDTIEGWGLIYASSDNRLGPSLKSGDASSCIEEAGEHADPRRVEAAFDYTTTFLVLAPNKDMTSANAVIAAFNRELYTQEAGSDIMRLKEITLYNDYKRVKVVGEAEPIAEANELYRRQNGEVMDCVEVELKIHVSNPKLCDWNMPVAFESWSRRDLRNEWWGTYVNNAGENKVYQAVTALAFRQASVALRVRPGDVVKIITGSPGENALPIILVDNLVDRNVIRAVETTGKVDMSIRSEWHGVLLVNCMTADYGDVFHVEVDRRLGDNIN